jgi:hypothetical protein
MTVRSELTDVLTPILPATWKIIPYERNMDALSAVTVMLKQSTIQDAPDAPQGKYQVGYTITIASPSQSAENAETDLDDVVFVLLAGLKSIDWLKVGTATKVLVDNQYYGYDIACTLQTKK